MKNNSMRSEFQFYVRYFANCPKCGLEHGFIGEPHIDDRIACNCGTRLVVVAMKNSDITVNLKRYYLERDLE